MTPNREKPTTRGPGPVWTKARLERVMRLRFGTAAGGGPDTGAAAAGLNVSRRTVQRWLHASHGRSLAHIPARRIDELLALLLPSEETRIKETQQAEYARRAVEGMHLPHKMGIRPAWERQRWLEDHLVVVLEIKVGDLKIRQLAVGRSSVAKIEEFRRRGRIIDQAIVPTRFHATILTHTVLTDLMPWRFQAGADQVTQGFTQAWLPDAPPTHLGRLAEELKEKTRNEHGRVVG